MILWYSMSDSMWTFRWSQSWRTPKRILDQQQKAIRLASQKLQQIDRQYSTKLLIDDIQAETLLTNLNETKTITGTMIGWIIQTEDGQIILNYNKQEWRGFPKGELAVWENETKSLVQIIQKQTGLSADNIILISRIGEFESYSAPLWVHKKYIRYTIGVVDPEVKLASNDTSISKVWKFDTQSVLDILENEYQKDLWENIQHSDLLQRT